MTGNVDLAIRFKNRAEYLKWKYYVDPNRKWEFEVSYPAIMRTEWTFQNSMEVEMLSKKIVSLLQMGFDVHSVNWRLTKSATETTP